MSANTETAAPATTAGQSSSHRRPGAIAAIVLVPILVGVMLSLFAWPAANLEPRNLPLGIAGPEQAVAPIEQGLVAKAGEDAFDVHTYPDEAAARAAIKD